ncbi:DUF2254 domain-containing protein [Thalassobacillus pellis]|uniref:DUF2254 domain-containing protein n=1 Tax=Thalassobacillus pellis TaxID=748008 RepID=UPI0019607A71|nr:DUF2254 domain-containing protein [Thalassobacillus pellis]MBM7554317.1 putative membrane protein [Thalassobacillus pellis]
MFLKLLPSELQKYFQMSKQQRKHEIQKTLWFTPFLYVFCSLFLVALTLYLDYFVNLSQYIPSFFHANAQPTRMLVSALIGGILTLSAFTLNSLLVVLTTFSGQFSPRMLLNFVGDRKTQHVLGIFHGSFVYVLVVFLFVTGQQNEVYVAIPFTTVLLAFFTVMVFIFFINHATTWMQVHNITLTMKNVSKKIVKVSLSNELEAYRAEKPGDLYESYRERHQKIATATKTGYIQVVDFRKMLEEARKDDIIIKLHAKVGDFTLINNRLFSYWGPGKDKVNEEKYCAMFEIGHKETEVQDINMGMTKLSEIGIKGIGNNDPKTVINTIHQMADLLVAVEDNITFTRFLNDKEKQVRVLMDTEDFDFYLYRGFGYIRHYANENYPIITEIITALSMVAQSISGDKHDMIWNFASNTVDHISSEFIYDLDREFLLKQLYELALITNHEMDYYGVERRLLKLLPSHF